MLSVHGRLHELNNSTFNMACVNVSTFSLWLVLIPLSFDLFFGHVNATVCELSTCCSEKLDILFLVDSTTSDGQTKNTYTHQVTYLQGLTQSLKINETWSRVGVITYAEHPHPQFDLNPWSRTSLLKDYQGPNSDLFCVGGSRR